MYPKGTKLRDQTSSDQDAVSARFAVSCPASESRVRHEFGPDVHLPTMLARLGRIDPLNPSRYGVQDFTGDLTVAYELDRNAETIYNNLPQALRDKYPTWRMFWKALTTGEIKLEDASPEPTNASPAPGGSEKGSESSAA